MVKAGNKNPCQWSISYAQLEQLEGRAKMHFGRIRCAWSVTMRDIVEHLVIPTCRDSGAPSLAQHLNGKKGLPVGAFVTHSWDGLFLEFVLSVKSAFHFFPKDKKPNLWICAFALPQCHGSTLQGMIGKNLKKTPFVRALRAATWFVVVRNSNKDIYNRIWCVCELMFARYYDKPTLITGPNTHSSDSTSCQYAQFSFEEDAIRIKEELLLMYGTYEDVDKLVLQYRSHPTMQEESYSSRVLHISLYIALAAVLFFDPRPRSCVSIDNTLFQFPLCLEKCIEHFFLILALMACDPIFCGVFGLTSLAFVIIGITTLF